MADAKNESKPSQSQEPQKPQQPKKPQEPQKPQVAWWKRLLLGMLSLLVASAIWLPSVHLFFRPWSVPPKEGKISRLSEKLAARHLHLWTDPELLQGELDKMRAPNPEWDFMGRSFLVWSLANICLREPDRKDEYLPVMDRIIDETIRIEQEKGKYHFLMAYAQVCPFVMKPERSQFLDGEIALMMAMRRLVEEKESYREPLRQRVDVMVERMETSPTMCAESYPDECWLFCNTVALAAIRVSDHLDGTDHSDFFRRWIETAKAKLIDKDTGILVSSFTLRGTVIDGPEGSSIWLAAHCLKLIDEPFARQQYRLAEKELARGICGFGYAREWPPSRQGPCDIDSGPVIPVLEISAGSSGLAFVASRSFDDDAYFRSLLTTLELAGFPYEKKGRLKYCASNQVGDAVLLYSTVLGPAWAKVQGEKQP